MPVSALALGVVPSLALRLVGEATAPSPWTLIAIWLALLAGAVALHVRRRPSARAWVVAPILWFVLFVIAARAAEGDGEGLVTCLPAILALVAVVRAGLEPSGGQVVRDAGIAAALAFATPRVIRDGTFSWACFSPLAPAEQSAWGVLEASAPCVATDASIVLALLWVIARRRSCGFASLLPLVGLGALVLGTLGDELVTTRVASHVLDAREGASLLPAPLATAAAMADVLSGAGVLVAIATWTLAAGIGLSTHRSRTWVGWAGIAGVAPLVLASTSMSLAPPLVTRFPQQAPEAIWDRIPSLHPLASFHPLTRPEAPETEDDPVWFSTRSADRAAGLLLPGGALHVVVDGRWYEPSRWREVVALPPRPHSGAELQLLVDERATLDDLHAALTELHGVDRLTLVYLRHDLRGAERAMERWPFVELASRSLRGRTFEITTGRCEEAQTVVRGDVAFARCEHVLRRRAEVEEDIMVLRVPRSSDISVADLLDATAGTHDVFAFALPASTTGTDLARPRSTLTTDPIFLRVAPSSPTAAWVLGLLVGTLVALSFRALHARGSRSPLSRVLHAFVGARMRGPAEPRGGYRHAPEQPSGKPATRRGRRRGLFDAVARWTTLVTVATVLGIALSRLGH